MYELNDKEKKALNDLKKLTRLFFVIMLIMIFVSSYYETMYYAEQEAAKEQACSEICNSELGELIDSKYIIHSDTKEKITSVFYDVESISDSYVIWVEHDGLLKRESYSPHRVLIHKIPGVTSYISYSEAYEQKNYGINTFTMIELYLCPSDIEQIIVK